MTSRIQVQRFNNPAVSPANGSRPPGEVWLNFPTRALGMIDPTQTAVPLLGVRYYANTSTYAAGDYVVNAGQLLTCKQGIGVKPFTPSDWDPVLSQSVSDGRYLTQTQADGRYLTPSQADGRYARITGTTFTGPVTLAADPTTPLGASTKQYTDAQVATRLPLSGGTLSGPLNLVGNATSALQPTTLQQLNSTVGNYLPLSGGTVSGGLTVQGQMIAGTNAFVAGALYVNPYPNNTWEWYFTVQSNGSKLQNYRAGWYDLWDGTNGTRSWNAPSGSIMSLDGYGNLYVAQGINGNVVTASQLTSTGNINVYGSLGVNGNINAAGNMNTQGLFASYVHSSGDVSADNNLNASGIVSTGAGANIGGDLQMNQHWIQNLRGIGAVSGDRVHFSGGVQADSGDIACSNGWMYCNRIVTQEGIGGHSWSFGINGGYGYAQADGGAIFLWSASDERLKSAIAPSTTDGLALINATPVLQFTTDDGRQVDIGLIADQMPAELMHTIEGWNTVDTICTLAALVDAVQQLTTRIQALETAR